MIIDHFYF